MKCLVFLITIVAVLNSCSHKDIEAKFYGTEFDTSQAITVAQLEANMNGQEKIETVVTGTISASCKAEGCWMNLENKGGKEVYVDWDHKFNIPLKAEGKTAYIHGYAYYDSTADGKQLAFKATGAWL